MWVGECLECGARLANWMSSRHDCLPPEPEWHPYQNFFIPVRADDDE